MQVGELKEERVGWGGGVWIKQDEIYKQTPNTLSTLNYCFFNFKQTEVRGCIQGRGTEVWRQKFNSEFKQRGEDAMAEGVGRNLKLWS